MTMTNAAKVVHQQQKLALRLLERVEKPEDANVREPDLDMQLDVLNSITKWVAVKNRLEDDGDVGIKDFKRRIQGVEAGPGGADRPTRAERLEAIKSRLPDGRVPGARNGTRGEDVAAS